MAGKEEPETIYGLLPKHYVPPAKPPLYRSPRLRLAARQPPVASTFGAFGGPHLLGQARMERRAWAHWGPSESQAADPKVRLDGDGVSVYLSAEVLRRTTTAATD